MLLQFIMCLCVIAELFVYASIDWSFDWSWKYRRLGMSFISIIIKIKSNCWRFIMFPSEPRIVGAELLRDQDVQLLSKACIISCRLEIYTSKNIQHHAPLYVMFMSGVSTNVKVHNNSRGAHILIDTCLKCLLFPFTHHNLPIIITDICCQKTWRTPQTLCYVKMHVNVYLMVGIRQSSASRQS